MPEFGAGLGIERVDMAERCRREHRAVDNDRRRLHRFPHLGLENPGRTQFGDVAGVDLLARVKARLRVIAVRVKEIVGVLRSVIQLLLRDIGCAGGTYGHLAVLLHLLR